MLSNVRGGTRICEVFNSAIKIVQNCLVETDFPESTFDKTSNRSTKFVQANEKSSFACNCLDDSISFICSSIRFGMD